MRRLAAVIGGLVLAVLVVPTGARAQSTEARNALWSGRYEEAIQTWEALHRRGDATAADMRGLLAAYMRVGQYERAIEMGRDYVEASPAAAGEVLNMIGEALYATGDVEGATRRFAGAVAAESTDALTARLNLAIVDFERGARWQAMERFDSFIDIYNDGRATSASDLMAVARACTYLGLEDPQLFHDAVRAYDQAIAAAPSDTAASRRAVPRQVRRDGGCGPHRGGSAPGRPLGSRACCRVQAIAVRGVGRCARARRSGDRAEPELCSCLGPASDLAAGGRESGGGDSRRSQGAGGQSRVDGGVGAARRGSVPGG